MTRADVEWRTFYKAVVGSTVHGLNVGGGEDLDMMGVCIEPAIEAIGLGAPFEQFIYRSAAEREGKHDARSREGDLDLTVYSLRKFLRLAVKGNPTILTLLYVPQSSIQVCDARGYQLRELAQYIVSKQVAQPYLGYLTAQKQRMLGERGSLRVHRPELVEQYGFDTKYAMHMCRLGIQGVELLKTGHLNLPMAEPDRTWLRDLRTGKVSEQEALTRAGELEQELRDLATSSPLPDQPNLEAVETWMVHMYQHNWKSEAPLLVDRRVK